MEHEVIADQAEEKEKLQKRMRSLQIKFVEKEKTVENQEKELEEAFAEYEQLTKQLARKKRDVFNFKDTHEQLKAEVKLQRIRCKSLECDLLMVQKENEGFESRERELQNRTRDIHARYCEMGHVTGEQTTESEADDANESQSSSSGSIRDLETIDNIKHLYNDVTSVEAALAELLTDIAEKNRNFAESKSSLGGKMVPSPVTAGRKSKTPVATSFGVNKQKGEI